MNISPNLLGRERNSPARTPPGSAAPIGAARAAGETRNQFRRENAELRPRIAQLGAASLRIGSGLDLDTVLGETAESARALTGARYAAIATIDDVGAPQDVVTSGFT